MRDYVRLQELNANRVIAVMGLAGTGIALGIREVIIVGSIDPAISGVAVLVLGLAVAVLFAPRWIGYAAPLPLIALVATEARPEIVFYLERPADTSTFVLFAGMMAGASLAAVAGISLATAVGNGAAAAAGGLGLAALASLGIVAIDPYDNFEGTVTAAERRALPRVDLLNYAYHPIPEVDAGVSARFVAVNDTALTHTFTVKELGLDVYVPPKTDAVVEVMAENPGRFTVTCEIDDHIERGMTFVLEVR